MPLCPFDLHTLGTPLAFVLSQDQTLHQNVDLSRPRREREKGLTNDPATPRRDRRNLPRPLLARHCATCGAPEGAPKKRALPRLPHCLVFKEPGAASPTALATRCLPGLQATKTPAACRRFFAEQAPLGFPEARRRSSPVLDFQSFAGVGRLASTLQRPSSYHRFRPLSPLFFRIVQEPLPVRRVSPAAPVGYAPEPSRSSPVFRSFSGGLRGIPGPACSYCSTLAGGCQEETAKFELCSDWRSSSSQRLAYLTPASRPCQPPFGARSTPMR